MNSELDRVRSARPQVVSPSDEVRSAARRRLLAAIADEPSELYDRRRRDAAPRPRVKRRSMTAGLALAGSAIVVAAVIGAVLVFGNHSADDAPGHPGGATRGAILASGGQVLAGVVHHYGIQVVRRELPSDVAARTTVVDRLAALLGEAEAKPCPQTGRSLNPVACALSSPAARRQPAVTVADRVPRSLDQKIRVQAARLPGVLPFSTTMVSGPARSVVADVIGQTSRQGHKLVGQTGLEAQYNAQLVSGDRLRTTLNLPLERVAERSLHHSIAVNHATGGAYVAMNPETGAIDAIGSLPGPRPNHSAFGRSNGAVQADGPTGATFAPITMLAALQSGAWKPEMTFDDIGRFCEGRGDARQCRENTGGAEYGLLNAQNALKVQSEDFLYNLGVRTNAHPATHPRGGAIQHWAALLGIGHKTGIDLPGEITGTLPTPAWRQHRNQLEHECDTATGPYQGQRRHKPGGCGIADGTNRPWEAGDNESLAAGQGDLQASPIQLAVAYAAIANGRNAVRPHLAAQLTRPDGTTVSTIAPSPGRQLGLSAQNLKVIRDGMRASSSAPGGTSDDVLGNLGPQVHGQVGSTQIAPSGGVETTSGWYAGYVPASATNKPIVVIVWIPSGGFGDVSAAPVAKQILSQWFTGKPGPYKAGTSTAG